MTRPVEQWLVTAPQETFEAVLDVVKERSNQEEQGYTPGHDDEHGVQHVADEMSRRINRARNSMYATGYVSRDHLVAIAALAIAAIETHDRREVPRG